MKLTAFGMCQVIEYFVENGGHSTMFELFQ